MVDRPIIFSAPMVHALLDGRKTQTRRVLKPQPGDLDRPLQMDDGSWHVTDSQGGNMSALDVPYAPGQRLWVREAHSLHCAHGQGRADGRRWGPWGGLPTAISPDGTQIAYFREGFDRCDPPRWRPSIHMPRWASRITLDVTAVRVERLQEISEADARDEGIEPEPVRVFDAPHTPPDREARPAFSRLWDSLYGAGAWDANPWVVVISFDVRKGNIDG